MVIKEAPKNYMSRSLGTYSIPDAVRYIYATTPDKERFPLNTRHLFHWTKDGLASGYLEGIRNRHLYINFRDLISLRIIAAMRAQGIKHKEIISAELELKKTFGWEYPFAMADFWVAKPDIYMKVRGVFLSVSRHLQYALDLVNEYVKPVHGLTFDLFGISASWTPHNDVLLDPEIQYGSPCISGTRVPTEVIWSFHDAGDSVETLAYMYSLQSNQIKHAIEWEEILKETTN
jgi:uncharacterized protein (DUF433 family)